MEYNSQGESKLLMASIFKICPKCGKNKLLLLSAKSALKKKALYYFSKCI